ncbi:MAG: hypothetical protein ACI94Y_001630 [Maribacter sp.]|jgi:hypothetical protein
MRPKLFLTKEIKDIDPSDEVKKEVYKRVTQNYAEKMLYSEFKRVRSLSTRGKPVEFTLIEKYPYKKKNSSPNFINEDEDGVVYAPILVFGWQRKFLTFRKKYNFKPVLQGMCTIIDRKAEDEEKDNQIVGSDSNDFNSLSEKDNNDSDFDWDEEDVLDEDVPNNRHIAFVVEKSYGVMSYRVIRDILEPIKNQLGIKRFHIYDKMPKKRK